MSTPEKREEESQESTEDKFSEAEERERREREEIARRLSQEELPDDGDGEAS